MKSSSIQTGSTVNPLLTVTPSNKHKQDVKPLTTKETASIALAAFAALGAVVAGYYTSLTGNNVSFPQIAPNISSNTLFCPLLPLQNQMCLPNDNMTLSPLSQHSSIATQTLSLPQISPNIFANHDCNPLFLLQDQTNDILPTLAPQWYNKTDSFFSLPQNISEARSSRITAVDAEVSLTNNVLKSVCTAQNISANPHFNPLFIHQDRTNEKMDSLVSVPFSLPQNISEARSSRITVVDAEVSPSNVLSVCKLSEQRHNDLISDAQNISANHHVSMNKSFSEIQTPEPAKELLTAKTTVDLKNPASTSVDIQNVMEKLRTALVDSVSSLSNVSSATLIKKASAVAASASGYLAHTAYSGLRPTMTRSGLTLTNVERVDLMRASKALLLAAGAVVVNDNLKAVGLAVLGCASAGGAHFLEHIRRTNAGVV